MFSSVDEISSRLRPVFQSYGVRKAVLFGSYAKGCATGRSDVDLCVDSGLKGLRFVGLMEAIRSTLDGVDADVLDVTHVEQNSKVDTEIRNTGVVIYTPKQNRRGV